MIIFRENKTFNKTRTLYDYLNILWMIRTKDSVYSWQKQTVKYYAQPQRSGVLSQRTDNKVANDLTVSTLPWSFLMPGKLASMLDFR